MNDQQNTGVPNLYRIGQKQYRPRRRHAHVHDLRDLNHLAAVVAIRHGAEIDRQQEKRRPVADDGEPGQHRRLKLLKQQPVADHMFDVVRHHGEHGGDKKQRKSRCFSAAKATFGFELFTVAGCAGCVSQCVSNELTVAFQLNGYCLSVQTSDGHRSGKFLSCQRAPLLGETKAAPNFEALR